MTNRTDVETLIGSRFEDQDVQSLLARLDPGALVEDSDGKINWISRAAGLSLSVDARSGRTTAVFAYGGGYQKYEPFGGALPGGVSMDLSREQVRERFGPPDKSGREHDFWQRDDYKVSIVYFPTGGIKQFVLMS